MNAQTMTHDRNRGSNRKLEALGQFSQSMLLELRTMAQQVDAQYFTYVLELALIEASDLASGKEPSPMAEVIVEGTSRPDPNEIARRILETAA